MAVVKWGRTSVPTNLKFSNVSYVGLMSHSLIFNMSGYNADFMRFFQRLQNILTITQNITCSVFSALCVVFRLVNVNVNVKGVIGH
jgi:hypothetical protein